MNDDTRTEAVPVLRAQHLSKRFPLESPALGGKRHLQAVDGVDLAVARGETLGIVGESGCGKSTLGRLLLGLTKADQGVIEWNGRPIGRHDGTVQAVFQDPSSAFNPRQRVKSAIAEALPASKRSRAAEHVAELLHLVGLGEEFLRRRPHELSGGQLQRVGIARAIASDPAFILLDEAVSSLDSSLQMQVVDLLRDIQHRTQTAYVFISHDLRAVRAVSDRIAVMYLGQIVELAPAQSFEADLRHPYSVALRSAEPALPFDEFRPERIVLRGDPPSAVDLPRGCRFATRCPVAQSLCHQQEPELQPDGDGRLVRCHFPGSLELKARTPESEVA